MRNPTLLQCFHWYYPTGGELWREVTALAPNLNEIGINMVWLPPAYKGASGGYSVGYDSYDLFDLGEFDQKSAMRSSNVKPGRATPSPFGPGSIHSSSGITNASAVSTTLKTPMRTVSSKS